MLNRFFGIKSNPKKVKTSIKDPFCSDPLNARLRILLIRKHTLTKREFQVERDALFKEIKKN
jgi:hypothetical protein